MNGPNIDAQATGRRAFWDGKALWANPFTGGDAERWKIGWKNAKAAFGPGAVTAAALAERRPADLPLGTRTRRVRQKPGAGIVLAGARAAARHIRTVRPWEFDF